MPLPKPASTRQRQNRTSTIATIEASRARRPELPTDIVWHHMAIQTWNVWWDSPLRSEWVQADTAGMIELIRLVHDFWSASDSAERVKLRGEIRQSSAQYGLSPISRRQLQWEIKRIEERTPVATPTLPRDPRLRSVG